MRNLKKILSPDDVTAIEATDDVNWVPKDPAEVILPYIDDASRELNPDNEIQERIEWTKEVVDGYQKLIIKCRGMEAEIEDRCRNVKTSLNPATDLRVMDAMGRVFGIETNGITFEQYKTCIKELAALNNETIPSPGV